MDFSTHHHSPVSPYPYPHSGMQQQHANKAHTGALYCGAQAEAFPIGAQQTWSTSRPQHTVMPTEPLSLFAQTLKELDDKFYATFPAAKQAAIERWQLKQAQADTYPPAFDTDRGVEATYDSEACQPYTHYPENIHYPNTGGELNTHYHYPAYVPTAPLQPPPHEVAYDDGHQFVSLPVPATVPVLAPEFLVPSNHIIPTQRGLDTEAGVVSVRRSIDSEAPPSPPDSGQFAYSPSSYADSPPSVGSPFIEDDTYTKRRHSHEATSGQWPSPSDATAQHLIAPTARYSSALETVIDSPPIKSESPSPQSPTGHRSLRRHTRSHPPPHGHPYAHGSKHVIRPLPWSRGSVSPHRTGSPPPKRTGESKKPPLACLFCRGRKIACGPPLPGSKTCNQCQRRSLTCEYPLESRRGMRKKKTPPGLNSDGPKVTVTKRTTTVP